MLDCTNYAHARRLYWFVQNHCNVYTKRILKTDIVTCGQSRETGNIGQTSRRKIKSQYATHHYTTNNVDKPWAVLQTTGGKDEPHIVFTVFLYNNKCYILPDKQ